MLSQSIIDLWILTWNKKHKILISVRINLSFGLALGEGRRELGTQAYYTKNGKYEAAISIGSSLVNVALINVGVVGP